MQNLYQAFVLAIVQGITEFLPVSSSAHLILFPKLLHWPDQGLAFDVAIHVGTLCAVIAYFRHELKLMIRDWLHSLKGGANTKNSRLAWAISFGTIPTGLAALLFHDYFANDARNTAVIATSTIIFGVLLAVVYLTAKQKRNEYSLTWKDVIIVGCAQALALIPGTSRSGITLTAGLFVGLTRQAAARYSFLLSIPVILLAGAFESYKLLTSTTNYDYQALLFGFVVAAISGYICIDLFLRLLQRFGVIPFVVYRLALGILLFAVFGVPTSI